MPRFINSSLLSGLKCLIFCTALLLVLSVSANAREVTLQWDANSEPDLSHYVVYWGENSGDYTNNSGDIGLVTTYSCQLPDDGEIYYFAVTAVDEAGLESDYSNEVSTEGISGNSAPLAAAGPDQNINEGALVYLDASNSNDPDGEIVSYLWEQTGGVNVVLDAPASIETSFYAPSISSDGESLTFRLTVTDNEGLQSSDTCIINIVSVNLPPSADAGPDQNVNEGSMVNLDGTNSNDPDGDSLTYKWIQTGGTSITLDNSTSAQPLFDSPYIESAGESLTFQLTVTDAHGLQSTDSCIVNIISVNNPPAADAGPDQNVNEGSLVYLSGANSSDPDGDSLTYQWVQTGGTAVSMSNSGAVQPTFTAPYIDSEGESITFQLTVTDMGGLKSTDTCVVNIVSVNNPPSASAGPDQTVNEGAVVTLNGSGSTDPDGDALTFKWVQTSGTSVTLSSSTAVNPSFETFLVDPEGESLTFQLTVTDKYGLQATDTCIINITWVNDPPVADAGEDQNVDEGTSVTLDGSGSMDPDGNILSYKWTQVSGPAVTFNNSTTVNPAFDIPYIDTDGESMTFQLTVTDEGSLQSTDTCIVNIIAVNNPPVADAGADQTVDESSSVTLNGSGSTDPDGDAITYKWTQVSGPVVTLTNAGSVQAGFVAPDVDKNGAVAVFQLTVTDDGGLQSADSCTVNIVSVNTAPVANAGADQKVDEGSSVTLNGSGSNDPDGDALTYTWAQVSGPVVILTSSGSVLADFTAPDVTKDGATLVFQLTVTDEGGLESTDTCSVNIIYVNNAPVADAGADQTVAEGVSVTLNGSGSSDPDGEVLSYRWAQVSGPAVTLNNSGSIQLSFMTPDVGINGGAVVFQLTVTDEGGLSSSDTCTVNVSWVNQAPAADAGADQAVNEGTTVMLKGTGSSDPDGETLTYKWTQVSGPAVTINNAGSAVASFTAPDVSTIGDFVTFQLTVTDPEGLQATDRCIINILSVNVAPVADAGSDQTADELAVVTLNGSGSMDPDGDTLSYEWIQISGPAAVLSGTESVKPTFIAPAYVSGNNTVVFQLIVTDEGGLQSVDQCTVTIKGLNNTDLTGNWNSLMKYRSRTERTYILNGSFTVHNNGSLVNKSFRVSFYLSKDSQFSSEDILIYNQSITSISADGSVNISLNQIKSSYLTSMKYVICRIDSENTIPEVNESNNEIASGF